MGGRDGDGEGLAVGDFVRLVIVARKCVCVGGGGIAKVRRSCDDNRVV